jgi:iron complex outermembrane receptor protein
MSTSPYCHLATAFAVAALATASFVGAQPAPASNPTRADQAVVLSAFEVSTTQGKGYTSTNSASGFKTNEPLIDIPQPILVVTRDLIDDIGYKDMSDTLQFAGAVTQFRGERVMLRGNSASILLDDATGVAPFMDSATIDSYQILRGPTSVLYIGTNLSGTIIKTSKKPLPIARRSLSVTLDQYGGARADFDLTGPLAQIGDAKFSYRLIGVDQESSGGVKYFKNVKDDRYVIAPSLQVNYHDTTLRISYDYWRQKHAANANSPITPNGKLFTGAGRDESWIPPNTMEAFAGKTLRAIALQKISPTWELRLQSQYFKFFREGGVMIPGGVDYNRNLYYVGTRYNDQVQDFWTNTADVVGKFEIAKIENQSAAGVAFSDERNLSRIGGRVTTRPFGTILATGAPGFPGVVPVSLTNPRLDTIALPQLPDYTPAAVPGSRARTYRTNVYYQHTLDIIRDRLSLIGGITFSKLEINNITNLAANPVTAAVTSGAEHLHRYGAVFKVTKDLALYAMESTTFAPQSLRDRNNNLFPNQQGKGQEVGVKTSLLDGRISSTISVFKLKLTNQGVFGGNLPGGLSFSDPIGRTEQKGIDGDIELSVVPNLQVILTGFAGRVTDQTGVQVSGTYKKAFSVFARYDVPTAPLKGLAVGGGLVTIGGRTITTGGTTGILGLPGNPPFLRIDGGHLVNLFANYTYSKSLSFRLHLNNVLDDYYPLGLQGPIAADAPPPRMVSLTAEYRF